MAESRTQRVKKNLVSNVFNKLITLALPFVIRTVIIQKLGAEYIGLGSLFTSILQVLNMAELGFSSAIVFSLYKPIAEENVDEVCALLNFYRKVYRIVGSAILGFGILLMPFLKYLIKGSYPADINLYILYLIFLLDTVISYFAFAYKSVILTASQRQDVISNINSGLIAIRSIVQIAILLLTKNYYLYIIWNVIFTVINNIVVSKITQKKYPQYVCRGNIDKSKKESIIRQIKGLAIGKISKTSRNAFDTVVLTAFCGLIEGAVYSNYYYVFNAVIGVIGILVNSLTASIGNSVAVESREKNYDDFKRIYYVFSWIGGWCTICLLCLYQPFMKLWAGEELVGSMRVMLLFCVYFYITQMGQARAMYTSAAGLWWELKNCEIAEMLSNIVLNFILGYFWGMEGILWATIITVFLFSVVGITNITYKYFFQCSSKEFWTESAKYMLITVCTGLLTYKICGLIRQETIIGFILKIIICLVIPNIIFAIISFSKKRYREYLFGFVKKIKL